MSFCIDNEKLLRKYEAIWTKIEELEVIELIFLPVCDDKWLQLDSNLEPLSS